MISVYHFMLLSSALFAIGLYGFLTLKNSLRLLMSLEIMLNSVALNFVIFNYFIKPDRVDGKLFALFVIAVAAAEVVVGMAILIIFFRSRKHLDITSMNQLRD